MNRFSALLCKATLILSALAGPAFADSGYNTCCDPCGPSFRVGVDFLLWKPDIDDIDFAATTRIVTLVPPVVTAGSVLSVNPKYWGIHQDWEPGIRVFFGTDNVFCGWDLEASYAYVSIAGFGAQEVTTPPSLAIGQATSVVITSPILPLSLAGGVFGDFQRAESRYNANYHAWDLLGYYHFGCLPSLDLYGFAGVAGLYLTQDWKTHYSVPNPTLIVPGAAGNTASVIWDSTYWGVGLKVGTGLSYELFENLSLFAKGSAVLLTGEPNSKAHFTTFNNGTQVTTHQFYKDPSSPCHFVPGYNIQTGGRIEMETCGMTIGLRAGYEFQVWHNIPTLRRFMGESVEALALSTSSNTTTFGIHGMFFGADVGF